MTNFKRKILVDGILKIGIGSLFFLIVYISDLKYDLNLFSFKVYIYEYLVGLPITILIGILIVAYENRKYAP